MSTRSSTRNLFPPLDNPELTIQRRPRVDPTLLNDFEMATNGNGDDVPPPGGGDLPVPDLQTMEELCQPTLNGRGGPIAQIAIQETNFGLKNDMIQQVQNSCQFHGLPGDDANKHLDKFLHVTQSIKVNGVTDDALHLYLFPHSLTHHATAWFDRLPRISITAFEQMAKMFLGKYFPPSMVMKLRNEITNFCQRLDESLFEACERYKLSIDRCPNYNMLPVTQIDTFYNGLTLRHRDTINVVAALKAEMAKINKNLMKVLQINQQVKAVTYNCETCGGPHSYNDCPATVGQTQNGGDLSRRYLTSMTKTKGATYELKWIEDLVPELWSSVQLKNDKQAYLGTSHLGSQTPKLLWMYDYGHLEEIEVRRVDQKLYTFREGDFKRLHQQDIEDMLLLLVQQKLTNLRIDEWRKILMRADELHKFSDGTLNDIRSTLHSIAAGIIMEYLPIRK
uniref:Retrotransposon gag domain-containing protein n=1 Tax=Tanacetum cinerariifolium TaxID=118510 RepID=A0A6L2MEK9_TANCI|nr:hypothetical protein [Tanacetum cinerariifolium]